MVRLLTARARRSRSARSPRNGRTDDPETFRRHMLGGAVGNVLEWYDFAVFGYFAPIIGSHFFPSNDRLTSLLSAFAAFAVAYFMRPVGGALFGHIGDRLGRKRALEISVLMMAIPTCGIGLLPTHGSIGVTASVLMVLFRLAQGLSVGGELIGSISFLAETAPRGRRGFFASWASAGAIAGIMLGSLVAVTLHGLLPTSALEEWGWRLPFLAGIAIGVVGLWMRRNLLETPTFEDMQERGDIDRRPVATAIFSMPGRILHLAALVLLSGGGFYILFVWWPTLLSQLLDPPVRHSLLVNSLSMTLLLVLVPVMGAVSDRLGRKPLLVAGAFGVAVLAWPLFHLVDHHTFGSALAAQLVFAVVMSVFMGPIPATINELFPPRARYSGMAIGYNLSLALFGGTAPWVATYLVSEFDNLGAPSFYLACLAFASLIAALSLPAPEQDGE
jgi:MHS family proline/betaine transporter-like MFS transporter